MRPRVDLFPPSAFLPPYDAQASSQVAIQEQAAIDGLAAAAERNTTGPEARLRRFIQAEMDGALRAIRADEARARALPPGSAERVAIERRIDARAALFRKNTALETLRAADEIRRHGGAGGGAEALARFRAMLPPALAEAIARGGAWIPGVPGAFVPRTDNGVLGGPTGLDYKVEW